MEAMIDFEGFHGTDNACVQSILRNGFEPSTDDSHWLGDGVYYFLRGKSLNPALQAEQWSKLQAWDKHAKINKYNRFSVLKSRISVDERYLLDLTTADGLKIFEYIKQRTLVKIKERPQIQIIDGFLINFARREMKKRFDVIKAEVYIKLSILERQSRIGSRISNCTICCVYDTKCIGETSEIKIGEI